MVITEDFESSDSGSNPDKTYQFFIVSLYYIMPRKVQGGRRSGSSGTFRPGGNSFTNQERSLNVRTLNASRDVNAGNQVTFPDGTSQATAVDPTKIENGNSSMEIASSGGACVFTHGDSALTTTFASDGTLNTNGIVANSLTFSDGTSQATAGGDPTKIENGNSSMEIGTENGKCVFTPAGVAGNSTTFAANGNVGISETDPYERLEVTGNIKCTDSIMVGNYIRPSGHNYLNFNTGGETGDDNKHYFRMSQHSGASAQVHFVNLSGDNNCYLFAAGYQNISDDRTKLNETPIENAMDTLKKLNPVTYDYYGNLDCSGVGQFSAGLVAQEVWYNCPELRFIISKASDVSLNHADISNDDWGTDSAGVNYTEIMPYMIKAIQDQQTTIEKLAERLAALEAK